MLIGDVNKYLYCYISVDCAAGWRKHSFSCYMFSSDFGSSDKNWNDAKVKQAVQLLFVTLLPCVTVNDISVKYVTAYIFALEFFNLLSCALVTNRQASMTCTNNGRHGTTLFTVYSETRSCYSGPLQVRIGQVIVLRRISDYGYITASLQSPFTTRWGYGGRILDLKPPASSRGQAPFSPRIPETRSYYSGPFQPSDLMCI